MRNGFVWLLLLTITMLIRPTAASALSCAEIAPPEKAYEQYDGIIVAGVENVKREGNLNRVALDVSRSYKGVTERKLNVAEDLTWGALNGPSERGAEYLFFLNNKDGAWEHPLCAPTVKTADAEAAAYLGYLQGKEIPLTEDPEDGFEPGSTAGWIAAAVIGVTLTALVLFRFKLRNQIKR